MKKIIVLSLALAGAVGNANAFDFPEVAGQVAEINLPQNSSTPFLMKFGFNSHITNILAGMPLELLEILSLTSKNPTLQVGGAIAGQAGGLVQMLPFVLGPNGIRSGLVRIPERVQRAKNAQYITQVLKKSSKKERRRLMKSRNKMLYSLLASTLLKAIPISRFYSQGSRLGRDFLQEGHPDPALIKGVLASGGLSLLTAFINIFITWKRHSLMRKETQRLLKRAYKLQKKEAKEERAEDAELAKLEAELEASYVGNEDKDEGLVAAG